MKFSSIAFLFIVFIIDRVLQRKFPEFYKKIQLPVNIVLSALVTIYCGFLIYGVYDVLTSRVSMDDKIFFVIFIGVIFSIYMSMVIITWKRWFKDRNRKT